MTTRANPIPPGFSTVTPYLTVSNAMKALEFYQSAFGAELLWCMRTEDGTCYHAELRIGNSMVMVHEEVPVLTRRRSPSTLGGSTVGFVIYVEDVDHWFERAVAAGATVTSPPKLRHWGDINAFITDPFGHTWTIAKRIEELSFEEAERRTNEHWRKLVETGALRQGKGEALETRQKLMAEDPFRELGEDDFKRIGAAFFGHEDTVRFYGMDASRFFASGLRVTSRMALESCPDPYASQIAERIAPLISSPAPEGEIVLIEPFAGLGNLAYHLAKRIHPSRTFYIESDETFAAVARHNLQLLGALGASAGEPVTILHAPYTDGLARIAPELRQGSSYVVIVDPPWGSSGKDPALGMDLGRTEPPIPVALREISAVLRAADPDARVLYVLKTRELVQDASLRELEGGFDLAARDILAAPGSSRRFGLIALRERSSRGLAVSQSSRLPASKDLSFASDELQQTARQRLADAEMSFRFLDALEVLASSLDDQARLSPAGRLSRNAELIERLVIQGRLQQQLQRHPEIADLPIPAPVVVTALPRTGTTLLHNLLAQHSRLRGPALWELMYPVDPAGAPGTTNKHLRDETARQRAWVAQHAPKAVAAHYQDADWPDECRHLMERAFRSFVDMMGNRVPRFERWLMRSDMAEPYAYHRLQLQHIVWRIPAERLVLKDVLHLYFLPELLREYADAKVVILHRSPLEQVPSAISLALAYRPLSSTAIDVAEESQRWLDRLADGVKRMMRVRPLLPAGRILDITYPRLLAQPMDVLTEIAEFADIPLTRHDEQRMSTYLANNPQNKHGVHHYSLEQFKLTPADIERHFADYRAAFGV